MIRAEALSKRFWIYDQPVRRLMDWMTPGPRRSGREFWALRDINLDIPAGSSMGIVGMNGAGKSTLLKLLAGTTVPTEGTFTVEGRVAALLELGMGFHPDFTGRENIQINAKLSMLGDEELAERMPTIIEFSELGDFIDQPLRTYSSGMMMRLAFAVATSVDPDVLIVDEALSVGDIHFQQKCLKRIREFHDEGVTVLFVSHDPALVKSFCDQAVLLDAGELVDSGSPDGVLDHYNALLAEKYRDGGSKAKIVRPDMNEAKEAKTGADGDEAATGSDSNLGNTGHRSGNFDAEVTSVEIRSNGTQGNAALMTPGMEASILVGFKAHKEIKAPTVGVQIRDRLGNVVYGVNTVGLGVEVGDLAANTETEVAFTAPMNLGPGAYTVTVAVHGGTSHAEICYDWIDRAATFQILPSPTEPFVGVARLEMKAEVKTGASTAGDAPR